MYFNSEGIVIKYDKSDVSFKIIRPTIENSKL